MFKLEFETDDAAMSSSSCKARRAYQQELRERTNFIVQKLSSGYYRIQGIGPCNWTQPPNWPCDEATLRAHAFPEASERFLYVAAAWAQDLIEDRNGNTIGKWEYTP
jgi:hypothetical protein